ncbi:hypothetical protein HanHA300_Chr04g0123531 [Helianthus annuus]|nr:hypothetical protein HanHA300_Chr04g0123531 [Helianthus annuus]KAJ0595840.1 hypothetical protein HanHA89_Chr04g0136001 [Helianthus annuus]KAJ0756501.1 hypothetical protein HanLR1_Chr04g0127881 [Helianthus annuus]KAJ0760255.1 hypothetical protein HanOQP8_Chr04g0135951 [Helianthus annuus]
MYLGGFNQLASSSSAQQPKLQTAFVSNTNSSPFPQSAPPPVFDPSAYFPLAHLNAQAQAYSKPQFGSPYIPFTPPVATTQPQFDPSAYIHVPQPQAQPQQQQAHYTNNPPPLNPNTVKVDTSNLSSVSIEVAKEHMELINTMVSAYCGLIACQIGNINLTNKSIVKKWS